MTAVNYWPDARCARAFWGQQDAPAYQRLRRDTLDWCDPQPGEHWLDLGCGGGPLSRGLWERSGGTLAAVVGADCAAANAASYDRLRDQLSPPPGDRLGFVCHDFSGGLGCFADGSFDHAVSGLSVTYAEDWDAAGGRWTDRAYDRVLAEVARVLRPGGRFVLSVNVPDPSWLRVALASLGAFRHVGRPLRFLKRSARMLRYGRWLKDQARAGRFHYLPAAAVEAKLRAAGFAAVEHRLSYAGQAFVFRATLPGGV